MYVCLFIIILKYRQLDSNCLVLTKRKKVNYKKEETHFIAIDINRDFLKRYNQNYFFLEIEWNNLIEVKC